MEAGVKAWWCWAKPCWTLQMESACWLTAWMASTSLCKFSGKAMALPLGTLTNMSLAGLVFLDVNHVANVNYFSNHCNAKPMGLTQCLESTGC